MNNRLALVGAFFAMISLACPTVATAQNPWRTDPQASGQYYDPPAATSAPHKPAAKLPKYAPLDGNLDAEDAQKYGYLPGYPGVYPGGLPSPYGYGNGLGNPGYAVAPGYGGLGLAPGYAPSPYVGGLGYPGLGAPGLGVPGLGGYSPGYGWGNSPAAILPFW
ncbi:hypothetical protein [Magnetovibrio blakemorei]|uniref:hypothetical protein n=1 Tax=Magnetovibrio blakemorei TaxID=28181 RepID=UPI000A037E1F|nr:hypothetical protein [Magnetovibrio blakemorei]